MCLAYIVLLFWYLIIVYPNDSLLRSHFLAGFPQRNTKPNSVIRGKNVFYFLFPSFPSGCPWCVMALGTRRDLVQPAVTVRSTVRRGGVLIKGGERARGCEKSGTVQSENEAHNHSQWFGLGLRREKSQLKKLK